jgi:hypothetical protein
MLKVKTHSKMYNNLNLIIIMIIIKIILKINIFYKINSLLIVLNKIVEEISLMICMKIMTNKILYIMIILFKFQITTDH